LGDGLVVVTGGGSGIGAATVAQLRDAGYEVLATGRRATSLAAVAAATGCATFAGDVARMIDNERLCERVASFELPLVGLVNAAGVNYEGSVGEATLEEWNETIAVNLTGTFDVTRQLLPALRAGGGSIVMVASVAADRAPRGAAAYAVSKAGMAMLGYVLAVEEGRGDRPVRCNVVNPGWTRTEMADREMAAFGAATGVDADTAYRELSRLVPLGRPGPALEVAQVIVWLLGPGASYVNGATVSVDGGHRLIDAGTVPFDYTVTPRQHP
jgi:meso-butanediol dehydrogenase / (S,S)-butanediol dehydrogenase / diacetyl reductase